MHGIYVASGARPNTGQLIPVDTVLKAPSPGQTKHVQIYQALLTAVQHYGPGYFLPTPGTLAQQIGVSRATVCAVYDRLAMEGYLKLRQRRLAVIDCKENWPCLAMQ